MNDELGWRAYQPCQAGPEDRSPRLNLSRLSAHEKRTVWLQIQRQQPALADLLQSPQFRALQQRFGADVLIRPLESADE